MSHVANRPSVCFGLLVLAALVTAPAAADAAPLFSRIFGNPATTDSVKLFGGGWADRNGDGYLDIYTSGDGNQFYENDGAGGFTKILFELFVLRTGGDHYYPMAIWADWNEDGHLDLYRATFGQLDANLNYVGPAPDILYRNVGPPSYQLLPVNLGPEVTSTSSMAWVDYDSDGDLDLSTTSANGTADLFYRNDGPGGFVSIVTLPFLGIGSANSNTHAWIDVDDDGDQDLYTVNHQEKNELWLSQLVESGNPDAFVQDVTSKLVSDGFEFDIAADWSDYDNDGDFDAFIAVVGGNPTRLFRNDGAGTFAEILTPPGRQFVNATFGAWGDADNDGDEDLFVGSLGTPPASPIYYRNDGGGTFVTPAAPDVGDLLVPLPSPQAGEWGDHDLDGDLDLYVITFADPNNASGDPKPNYLHRNEGVAGNHWLMVECEGTQSNRSAIGARVRVFATIDGVPTWQSRIVWGNMSGNSAYGDLRVHFGLGTTAIVDTLRVEWPSGVVQDLTGVAADQVVDVLEPGLVDVPARPRMANLEVVAAPNPFNPTTTLRFELAVASNVRLDVIDTNGRRVRGLADGMLGAGVHELRWDGRDDAGRPAATGVYLARIVGPGWQGTRKLVLTR